MTTPPEGPEPLLTTEDVCRTLGFTANTVLRLVREGRLTSILVNRIHRFRRADVDAFVAGSATKAGPDGDTVEDALRAGRVVAHLCLRVPRSIAPADGDVASHAGLAAPLAAMGEAVLLARTVSVGARPDVPVRIDAVYAVTPTPASN